MPRDGFGPQVVVCWAWLMPPREDIWVMRGRSSGEAKGGANVRTRNTQRTMCEGLRRGLLASWLWLCWAARGCSPGSPLGSLLWAIHSSLLQRLLSHSVTSNSAQPRGLPPARLLGPWTLQARGLEWVATPSSWGSSRLRDQPQVSCIAGRFFTAGWTTRETPLIVRQNVIVFPSNSTRNKSCTAKPKTWVLKKCCMRIQLSYFKSLKMMLWKCCTQYASKFGKLSSGHRTGKCQFLFQSQRKAMPKNAQTMARLHSFHMLAK